MALRRRGAITLPNSERLTLLDYQTPLKSTQANNGIGKIDLLGLQGDGTLAVIELKVARNEEDRRVGLLEGLIYAAIVEKNIDKIASEFGAAHHRTIGTAQPSIFLVAPPEFWSDSRGYPPTGDLLTLASEITRAIPIDIKLLSLCDAELVYEGQAPGVRGHAFLSWASDDIGATAPVRTTDAGSRSAYLSGIRKQFWTYRHSEFHGADELFEPYVVEGVDPVVFRATHSARNLLMPPAATPETMSAIETMIAPKRRHRDFGSMRSSQALTQSVFAGLETLGRLNALAGLEAEDGYPAFFEDAAGYEVELEHEVSGLGELSPTSVDAHLFGPTKIAVEVKFGEGGFGCCSRPTLTAAHPNYSRDYCDGNFVAQRDRSERCSLSERGVRYWEMIPHLFAWSAEEDHYPCPLAATYQLARNVLAATLAEDGGLKIDRGHALAIYDERNPSFHPGGEADLQWWAAVRALRYPRLLRRMSWQRLVIHLEQFRDLDWLTAGLREKYGLKPECPAAQARRR
jgi:hypothetical protein